MCVGGKTTGVEEGEFLYGGLGIGGEDWDLGRRTGDRTETMGDLEGGTGGWTETTGDLGEGTEGWKEDLNGKHEDLARKSGN